jgi:hypothetical protein
MGWRGLGNVESVSSFEGVCKMLGWHVRLRIVIGLLGLPDVLWEFRRSVKSGGEEEFEFGEFLLRHCYTSLSIYEN